MTSAPPRTTHHGPTQRELLDARSEAIGRLSFPDASDADGWRRNRAILSIIRGLNKYIAKGSVK